MKSHEEYEFHPPSSLRDLAEVRSADGERLYASADISFRDAVFGRDSVESAEDLLLAYPERGKEISEGVIQCLARLQGTKYDEVSEEEPGKIHHEFRETIVDGRPINEDSQAIFDWLATKWGKETHAPKVVEGGPRPYETMTYYGSVDATPLYVRLVAEYSERFGPDILDRTITRVDGTETTVRDSVIEATDWITGRLEKSDINLLEYKRSNPRGLYNQVWRDSRTSYLHADGSVADHLQPIATLELQGYAYDALMGAAKMLESEQPQRADNWRRQAEGLQRQTMELFWDVQRQYFISAIDRDEKGHPRKLQPLNSSPGELLDSGLLLDVRETDPAAYRRMVTGVATRLFSEDFLTEVGIRSRSLAEVDLTDFPDYHGSWAVWGKETYDIAKGLRRHRFPRLARELETRLVNGTNIAGGTYEFFYVSPEGEPVYDPHTPSADGAPVVPVTNIPEGRQAWTISALLGIKRAWANEVAVPVESNWQSRMENEILNSIEVSQPLKSSESMLAKRPVRNRLRLDREAGRTIKHPRPKRPDEA